MEREKWSPSECSLMVEICRYFAQVLFRCASSEQGGASGALPSNGVIPSGTIFFDLGSRPFRAAAADLRERGFASEKDERNWSCKLLVSSDQFQIPHPPILSFSNFSHFGSAFRTIFKTYEQNEKLGHPDTLKRIFELLPEAGLIEDRYGYDDWTDKALDFAHPPRWSRFPPTKNNLLWKIETFDWYLDEAREQWGTGA